MRIPQTAINDREGAISEVQKRQAGFESAALETPTVTAAHRSVGSDEQVPKTDATEVDEASGRLGDLTRLTVLRPIAADTSRPPDILSSPGSTAQTATTPVVPDGSPDTSPDNDGPHFPGNDDEEAGQHKPDHDYSGHGPKDQHINRVGAVEIRDSGLSRAASAQLLQESASAVPPSQTHTLSAALLSKGEDKPDAAKGTQPAASPNGPAGAVHENGPTSATQPEEQQSGGHTTSPKSQVKEFQEFPATQQTDPSDDATTREGPGPLGDEQRPTSRASDPAPPTHDPDSRETDQGSLPQDTTASVSKDAAEPSRHEHDQQEQAIGRLTPRKRFLTGKQGLRHKKPSIVVFEKRQRKQEETVVTSQGSNRPFRIPTDDYFVPLFFDGFTRQSTWMKSPEVLLGNTHKTLSSSDCQIVLQENQACKVLRRIYHLQQHDKWSLRQPKRCPEPTRQATTWDVLLQEMSWMRSDFREERKWKRAVARNLAEACAEWVTCSTEERKYLQVKATIPPRNEICTPDENAPLASDHDGLPTPIPDLVPSDDADSPMEIDEEPQEWKIETVAPSAIFALHDDEVVFPLQRTAASDLLLQELPLYGAPLGNAKSDFAIPEFDPDAAWRRPALPLTKYVEGDLIVKSAGLRPRQSRFKYIEEEDDDFEVADSPMQVEAANSLPPDNTDVALFRPEMKSIRDRLHAGHQFRPPTESLMPSQSFYENRLASQWTAAEDEELRRQVREYSYNWSLISKNISSTSLFISAEDRRTPWECFERWVQLEGFPNDVARTQYFQTYQRRIDSAQRAIAQANENANARPQSAANGTVQQVLRKRTLPIRVDKKPLRRHFSTIDAMKKLAKKREATAAKQQQTANNQNRRTSIENTQQKLPTKTPEDYSRLRHEREKQMHEKLLRFTQQQQEAQRQVRPRELKIYLSFLY